MCPQPFCLDDRLAIMSGVTGHGCGEGRKGAKAGGANDGEECEGRKDEENANHCEGTEEGEGGKGEEGGKECEGTEEGEREGEGGGGGKQNEVRSGDKGNGLPRIAKEHGRKEGQGGVGGGHGPRRRRTTNSPVEKGAGVGMGEGKEAEISPEKRGGAEGVQQKGVQKPHVSRAYGAAPKKLEYGPSSKPLEQNSAMSHTHFIMAKEVIQQRLDEEGGEGKGYKQQ